MPLLKKEMLLCNKCNKINTQIHYLIIFKGHFIFEISVTCGCSVASNWQPGRPRSDLHSNNLHHPDCWLLLNPDWQGRSTMFLRCLSSCDLNLSIEQEDTMRTYLGNLLNILMERHLKLL